MIGQISQLDERWTYLENIIKRSVSLDEVLI